MWMDGIFSDTRRRRGKSSSSRRRAASFTVHARTRERKAERRRVTTVSLLLVIIVAGLSWLLYLGMVTAGRHLFTENDRYRIETMDLQSSGPLLTPAHIREYAQLTGVENLFAINLGEIRGRLESVPIIASAEISRQLPRTLAIRVNERLAMARIGSNERVALASDRDGVVLGPGSVRPNLPVITGLRQPGIRPGVQITDTAFLDALRVIEWCHRPQITRLVRIQSIHISDPENLEIRLADGERIRLARAHLEARLSELVGIMQEQQGRSRAIRLINMTGEAHIPPVVQYQ